MLGKYCQSLSTDEILLCFYDMTSQNIITVMVGQCLIVNQFPAHQPALKQQ